MSRKLWDVNMEKTEEYEMDIYSDTKHTIDKEH